jgi:hypothetical protein
VQSLLADVERRGRMSACGRALVDGQGADRAAELVLARQRRDGERRTAERSEGGKDR